MLSNEIKIRCYIACAWGILVMFAFTGVLMSKPAAPYATLIIATTWVLSRIVREAIDCINLLINQKNK